MFEFRKHVHDFMFIAVVASYYAWHSKPGTQLLDFHVHSS